MYLLSSIIDENTYDMEVKMLNNLNVRNSFKIIISLYMLVVSLDVFSQGMSGGKERKENIYLEASRHEEQETHYKYSFKIPIAKSGTWSHSLSLGGSYIDLNNDDIDRAFGQDHFHSSSIGWNIRSKREGKGRLPWTAGLGYEVSGSRYVEKNKDNFSFRLMTGHMTGKGTVHMYGMALASSGSFRGIPFPFYVYSTKLWNQNFTAGFPFIGLSGPRKARTNYNFSLSPQGVSFKLLRVLTPKLTLSSSWNFSVDNYSLDSDKFSEKESLLIERQMVSIEGDYKITKKFSTNLSIGREFQRRYFKGENIFKKDDVKTEMESSNFAKMSIAYNLF